VASGEKTQGEETEWEFEHREMEPLTEFTEKDTEKRRKKEEGRRRRGGGFNRDSQAEVKSRD
jgi:hypothetical protein